MKQKKTVLIALRLDRRTAEMIHDLAKLDDTSMSYVIRRAIIRYLGLDKNV
jgi:hypothetical protein